MSDIKTTRREFVQTAAALPLAAMTLPAQQDSAAGLPTRVLGRTGVRVSILCLGGWHIGAVKDQAEAIRIMHAAVDEGLTFFDNSWDYHNGGSEQLMGKALEGSSRRAKVFLMTKNCERDYAGSMRHLEDSLRRLQTDYLDLWQFHEIIYDNDPDWVFEKGGLRAALEARKQGKVRYIGFTGHKHPAIHLSMLAKPHDWDAAQMPINVMDAHFRSFQRLVVPVCQKKNVGVIGMKGLGGGFPNGRFLTAAGLTAAECYRYCLSLPVASQVVGITSMDQLRQDVALARAFKPMTNAERSALLAKVKDIAGDGRHELFKTSQQFDGGHHRRQHGFDAG